MKLLPFQASSSVSLGVELEFQLIDPATGDLISRAKDLIRNISESPYQKKIKPEITQSMIEINSSIHSSTHELLGEMLKIRNFLLYQSKKIGINFAGGGTHPFQKWSSRKIFPSKRYRNLSRQYCYLSKRSTVFGQHIHIGCNNVEDAMYLTHALSPFIPHLIAMSASSPFYQGIDTGYHSSRLNVFSSFPTSGVMPFLTNWKEFSNYYYKLFDLEIIESMKDFYWDIRPKPEFGTVELRVCDTPLSIEKAVAIAAYVQTLCLYLLEERPINISKDLYLFYNFNRFQACRYGYDGEVIDSLGLHRTTIQKDILATIKKIEKYSKALNNSSFIKKIKEQVKSKDNDAAQLRIMMNKVKSLPKLVRKQCLILSKN